MTTMSTKRVKLKTHSGAAKRFKVTGTGKIVHRKSNRNHILTKKAKKRKAHLRKDGLLNKHDELAARRMLLLV